MNTRPRNLFALGLVLAVVAIVFPLLLDLSDTVRGLLWGLAAGCFIAGLLRYGLPEPCDSAPLGSHGSAISSSAGTAAITNRCTPTLPFASPDCSISSRIAMRDALRPPRTKRR